MPSPQFLQAVLNKMLYIFKLKLGEQLVTPGNQQVHDADLRLKIQFEINDSYNH
jgi:hypothetical protein